ncbi:MAG TPA: exopolysaccharide biosynthesis polyprenyl glycosylphosphotransferase, partial [Myxococcaceae bacterium]|nr:exopolysaccharide biosynthesis polyprenyl glycosylphosphotransferase [Myxococcaceae bacterium]
MFSRLQRFYTSIKVLTDMAVLAVAFALAYVTRFHGPWAPEAPPPLGDTMVTLAMVLIIFPLVFDQGRLYATNRIRSHLGEIFEIFKSSVLALLILVALNFFFRERYSRLTLGIFVVYQFVLIALFRVASREILNEIRRRGHNLKTILLLGAGEVGERVIETIDGHRELGFRVVGALARDPAKVGSSIRGVPIVGLFDEVGRILDARPVDQVVIALPFEEQHLIKPLMEELALRTVDVKFVPDLLQYMTLWGGMEEFGGLPIISLQGGPLHGWNLVLKRSFDMSVAVLALALSAPVMLVAVILVKLSSRGPILYRQERMGMDGRTFEILKFRTMRIDAEPAGARMASKDDPRRTWVGAFLRRYSIDELPQLFNVLRGDMSLVGPRPERPVFIEEFKRQIPR